MPVNKEAKQPYIYITQTQTHTYIHTYMQIRTVQQKKNTLWVSVEGRENISPIILAQMEMTWICTRLQRVIAAENLTACEGYESTRHACANDVILLSETVNRMMDLGIRNTPTVFRSPFLQFYCLECSGVVTHKKDKTEEKRSNRRQIQEGKLRSEQRML